MKKKATKIATVLAVISICLLCGGCSDGDAYDGLMLRDEAGKTYILEHNLFDTYFIDEIVDGRVVNSGLTGK